MEFWKRNDKTDTMDFCPCQLVTDLLRTRQLVTDFLRGNWCNGFWPLAVVVREHECMYVKRCISNRERQQYRCNSTQNTVQHCTTPAVSHLMLTVITAERCRRLVITSRTILCRLRCYRFTEYLVAGCRAIRTEQCVFQRVLWARLINLVPNSHTQ